MYPACHKTEPALPWFCVWPKEQVPIYRVPYTGAHLKWPIYQVPYTMSHIQPLIWLCGLIFLGRKKCHFHSRLSLCQFAWFEHAKYWKPRTLWCWWCIPSIYIRRYIDSVLKLKKKSHTYIHGMFMILRFDGELHYLYYYLYYWYMWIEIMLSNPLKVNNKYHTLEIAPTY